MAVRNGAVVAAVLLTSASLWAETPASPPNEQQAVMLASETPTTEPAPRQPLMGVLGLVGVADPLEKAGINVYGFIEGSTTYNFSGASKNFGRLFDSQNKRGLMNQLDLTVERTVDVSKNQFDIGGRMEWIYGSDAGFIHSNGLFDYYDSPTDPLNQVDLNQAYLDFAVPVGNGLRVRTGKFVTPMGWETINPTTNALFSHSYLFNWAIPFTHTGVMGTYQLSDHWLVEGGIFRGWDQSLEDNNGSPSYHLKLGYTSTDKKLGIIGQFVTGPEQADNTGDFTTVFDFQVSYALTDAMTIGANADIGGASGLDSDGDTAYWYGIANYVSYKLSDRFTLNGRGEWFRDEEGVRIGVAGNYYEVTLGLGITPCPNDKVLKNLIIRPEFRADFSSEEVFNDSDDHEQYTLGVDAIFKF
ncbi:MAG TPA: porin [Tepidisphaeraceae bacterium]|nr:porin [Tepidisphaeraceae bacterium]